MSGGYFSAPASLRPPRAGPHLDNTEAGKEKRAAAPSSSTSQEDQWPSFWSRRWMLSLFRSHFSLPASLTPRVLSVQLASLWWGPAHPATINYSLSAGPHFTGQIKKSVLITNSPLLKCYLHSQAPLSIHLTEELRIHHNQTNPIVSNGQPGHQVFSSSLTHRLDET